MLNINVSKLKAFAGHERRLVISWTTGGPKRWSIAHNLALSIRKNTPETRQKGTGVAEMYKKYWTEQCNFINYTVLMYLRNILWVCLCLCKFTIMCNYSTIDYRCTILYAQSNQTSSKAWLLMEVNTTVYSNVNSYMFKVQYTMCFAMFFLNINDTMLHHLGYATIITPSIFEVFFRFRSRFLLRKRLGCLQKRLKCFFCKENSSRIEFAECLELVAFRF